MLLPEINPEDSTVIPIVGCNPRDDDWAEWFFPYLERRDELDLEYVRRWYSIRAEEIERRTGSVMNALALVQEAVDRFVPLDKELEELNLSLDQLKEFVYIWGIDRNVSLSQLRSMSTESKLDIYVERFKSTKPSTVLCSLIRDTLDELPIHRDLYTHQL